MNPANPEPGPLVVSTADRPDLDEQGKAALLAVWPEFIFHDQVSAALIDRAGRYFPRFDVRLLVDDRVVAGGWGVALRWDGSEGSLPQGYDGALTAAIAEHEQGLAPDTLCVMAAAVDSSRRGAGLGGRVLTALRDRAAQAGLARMIAPVRPVLKAAYPLTPMANYARWTRADGSHVDPWVRTHLRLGATIVAPAPRSMIVAGSVADWGRWTGLAFPETGDYVVPGGLDLLAIDTAANRGVYAETNLWMRHYPASPER